MHTSEKRCSYSESWFYDQIPGPRRLHADTRSVFLCFRVFGHLFGFNTNVLPGGKSNANATIYLHIQQTNQQVDQQIDYLHLNEYNCKCKRSLSTQQIKRSHCVWFSTKILISSVRVGGSSDICDRYSPAARFHTDTSTSDDAAFSTGRCVRIA